jgi:hypothetical protein
VPANLYAAKIGLILGLKDRHAPVLKPLMSVP